MLDRFDGRGTLGAWLHRIAHREFLRFIERQRPQSSLEEVAEVVEPRAAALTEAVELREVIRKLPAEEAEIVVLHYFQGYNCQEIAHIIRAPVGTVKYRLSTAREHLQHELGEGDLAFLNGPSVPMREWAWLPPDRMSALEARLSAAAPTFRSATSPAVAPTCRSAMPPSGSSALPSATPPGENPALLHSAPGEAETVDTRLARKVTLAFKATALSDLCARQRADAGIEITAGPSVTDEKVTLFCEKLPLRDVMRQLSRPFGYAWVRSKRALGIGGRGWGNGPSHPNPQPLTPNAPYRYELVQDLRSQLLEEELRNRDRNAALLALDREMERFRPYLDLAPGEALAMAAQAPPEEKKRLEQYAGSRWGLVQMYFRLSPQQLAALRAGQALLFSPAPEPGLQRLPPDLARGILESQREHRLLKKGKGFDWGNAAGFPEGQPLTAFPEAQPVLSLVLGQTNLGQFTLAGGVGFALGTGPSQPLVEWQEAAASFAYGGDTTFGVADPEEGYFIGNENVAVGVSPPLPGLRNEIANARWARDPALQQSVTVQPRRPNEPSRSSPHSAQPVGVSRGDEQGREVADPAERKVTTADVLEALHRATGMPIIADFYTRLYPPGAVSVRNQRLFDALNQLSDAMRLRWHKDAGNGKAGPWLQFRSSSFYYDRLKEVPNRLLARWSAARQKQGALPLDDLLEIAQLSDAQLDAAEMAEGARDLWGLADWDLARTRHLRAHLRFLAGLTPDQRLAAMRPEGLAFTRMSLAQQQQYLALALGAQANRVKVELTDLAEATLRVQYLAIGNRQWVAPEASSPSLQLAPRPPLSDEERERAIQSARRFNPSESEEKILARLRPELDLQVVYLIGTEERHRIRRRVSVTGGGWHIPD